MKSTSKRIVESTAEILNNHLARETKIGQALRAADFPTLAVVNELLAEVAEGGRLVAAVESDGSLLGYVPRYQISVPELVANKPIDVDLPPPGPDDLEEAER